MCICFLFIRYRAIKVLPSNYFNTLRGAWSDFHGPTGLLKLGRFGQLSSEIGTTWAELSWPTFLWDELSWADLSLGRVVCNSMQKHLNEVA